MLLVRVVFIVLVGSVLTARGSAQQQESTKAIKAVAADVEPVIDGDPSETVWNGVAAISDFLQQEPSEGGAPSEKTEIRILYTEAALFIAAWCWDSDSPSIQASDRRRDSDMESDDTLAFVVDTFHQHRDAYSSWKPVRFSCHG
jgi:hypothetical protein